MSGDPASLAQGVVAHDQVAARAREVFRQALAESFGRHIRAIERRLIFDEGFDLARIHVISAENIPMGVARLVIAAAEYEKHSGSELLFPGETTSSRVVAKHVFVAVGTEGMRRPQREVGRELENYEDYLAPKVRLALAHELGHLALGHFVGPDGQLRVPRDLSDRTDEEEAAILYAVALTCYSGRYLSTPARREQLTPSREAVLEAAEEIWGDDVAEASVLGQRIRDAFEAPSTGLPPLEGYDNPT